MPSLHLPALSIIIPALNEEKCLPRLLDDLTHQSFTDFEVIVVDGHSEDRTMANAQTFIPKLPRLTLLTSPVRHVSYQRNLGATAAHSSWLIFMDADNRLPPYFLQGLKYQIEAHSPDIFTTFISPDSHYKKDEAIASLFNLYFEMQKNTTRPTVLESLLGIYRPIFTQLTGFDDNVGWGEGNELCRRARQAGYCLTIFTHPRYTYSFRRLRQQGTLKTARAVAQLELSRILNIPLSRSKTTHLYPMTGGTVTPTHDHATTTFEHVLKNFSHISALPRELWKQLKAEPKMIAKIKSLFINLDDGN